MNSIREVQTNIAAWADTVFPHRTVNDALTKLVMEEIPELLLDPSPEELADVLVLVLDVAHLMGVDIQQAVHDKMEINRKRRWIINAKTGLLNHIKE